MRCSSHFASSWFRATCWHTPCGAKSSRAPGACWGVTSSCSSQNRLQCSLRATATSFRICGGPTWCKGCWRPFIAASRHLISPRPSSSSPAERSMHGTRPSASSKIRCITCPIILMAGKTMVMRLLTPSPISISGLESRMSCMACGAGSASSLRPRSPSPISSTATGARHRTHFSMP